MTKTPNNLLYNLLEQLEPAPDGIIWLASEQLKAFDPIAIAGLQEAGILEEAQPKTNVICDGCEQRCPMPVEIRESTNGRPASAFVICDKRDDMGRIHVNMDKLRMQSCSMNAIAHWLAKAIPTHRAPQVLESGAVFSLGTASVKSQRHDIFLCKRTDSAVLDSMLKEANTPVVIGLRNGSGLGKCRTAAMESLAYFDNGQLCIDHQYLLGSIVVKPKGKVGAKPQHDWPAYKKQFDTLIANYGRPGIDEPELKNQAAIEKHLIEWGEATFGTAPSIPSIRRYVAQWLEATGS